MMNLELPSNLQKVVSPDVWSSWSVEQRSYILETEGQLADHPFYPDKRWELGEHRPKWRESCPKCQFEYCFYAKPRNWTIGNADVWNLMKCANEKCRLEFQAES